MISQITVDGNLTRDPQERTFPDGNRVITATIGHNQGHYDQNHQWVDTGTMWIDVQARETDPILSRAHKGDHIIVSGTLSQTTYKGKDGSQRTALHLRVQQSGIIPRRPTGQQPPAQQTPQQQTMAQQPLPQSQAPAQTPADPWSQGAPAF